MAETAWRNRIVGYADVPPDQLVPSDYNFRRHPKPQQDALTGLIGSVGYIDPVLVQQGTDRVIDGHLRVELALRTNQPTVPVQYVDLTDAEADLALASFDPVSAMAYHDAANLDAGGGDVWAEMPGTSYAMLRDNDHTKKRAAGQPPAMIGLAP